jgi:hypothetical protein
MAGPLSRPRTQPYSRIHRICRGRFWATDWTRLRLARPAGSVVQSVIAKANRSRTEHSPGTRPQSSSRAGAQRPRCVRRGLPRTARAPAFRALDPQHVELANQVAEDDRAFAGHCLSLLCNTLPAKLMRLVYPERLCTDAYCRLVRTLLSSGCIASQTWALSMRFSPTIGACNCPGHRACQSDRRR